MADNDTVLLTPVKAFNTLLKNYHRARKQGRTIAGEIGQEIKEAVEKNHLHKGAFALFAKLDAMDELKRNDFLRAFDVYRDRAEGEKGTWNSAGDILDRSAPDEGEESGDKSAEEIEAEAAAAAAAHVKTNVTRLRGIRKKADDAEPVVGMPSAPAPEPAVETPTGPLN